MQLAAHFSAMPVQNRADAAKTGIGPVAQRLEQGTHKRKTASTLEPQFLRKTSGKQSSNALSASFHNQPQRAEKCSLQVSVTPA
jgi:hypothetical protein